MKRSLLAMLCVLVLCVMPVLAQAQPVYPTKPVRMIVPFPPGGGNDLLARLIGQKLSEMWGQSVIVDNKPGGNTIVGTEALARATPDGYTLMLTSSSHVIIPSFLNLPFDAIKSFSPVTTVSLSELVLAVNPEVPASNLQQLIALAKAKPDQLNFASGGSGNPNHLAGEMFKTMTGTRMVHVPYKGGGPALADAVAGQIPLVLNAMPAVIPHVKAGRLKALAVTSPQRHPLLPAVQTFQEAGVKDFVAFQWYGVLAPAGTPAEIVNLLNREINKALALPDVKERFVSVTLDITPGTPADFLKLLEAEDRRWKEVVKDVAIRLD